MQVSVKNVYAYKKVYVTRSVKTKAQAVATV